MREADFDGFVALLDGALALNPNWRPLMPAGKALFFKAMAVYSLEQVSAAMTAHVRDRHAGMFQPMPAHLIAHIEANAEDDGRPGADEAWALCLKAQDEDATVVWTAEMQEAFNLCRPALDGRGNTAARMAFREAYERLVGRSRKASLPAAWSVSLGHDVRGREAALLEARSAGRLPLAQVVHAAALLPSQAGSGGMDPVGIDLVGIDPVGLARLKAELEKVKQAAGEAAQRRGKEREQALLAAREKEKAMKARMKERLARYREEMRAEMVTGE